MLSQHHHLTNQDLPARVELEEEDAGGQSNSAGINSASQDRRLAAAARSSLQKRTHGRRWKYIGGPEI
jgi:hypothetical protein